jgi:pyruvate dehydrogenase E2 component (dihydrolipoamide acetyltransferase)
MADITLPQLGETVTEGTITRWFKKVGEAVAADEPLFEVSTDKVDTEVPSPIAGTLTEIRVVEGDTVAVGTIIAVVGGGAAAPAAPASAQAPAPTPAPTPAPAPAAPVAATPPPPPPAPAPAPAAPAAAASSAGSIVLSPVVRRILADAGISPDSVRGTGPGGRITRDDALAAAGGSAPASIAPAASAPAAVRPVPAAPRAVAGSRDEVVALSNIRRATGAHMVASLATSPHSFSVVEVDYANVEIVRSRVRDEFRAAEGFGLTHLPFVSRAVVDALVEFPHLNASVSGDDLIVHRYVDLGIAVDLDGNGLLAPVVRDAETKRLRAIAREIRDLADRARNKQLAPDEIQGGTFTISNNGWAGSVLTMPIINQPQVAILSTDAVRKRPVVIEGAGDSIAIHPVGNLAMSWDHRAFDGAYAAAFLVRVKEILETRDWTSEV